ncbi:potassium channel protein, partial [Candidatus Woesearchaeota archaeon CG_4_10_14_0_2_um_filter_57_5]
VLTVKGLNKDATVIAKAHDAESEKKLRRAGADMVVSSASIAANRMASVALRPTVVDFLDTAMQAEGAELEMEEIPVEEGAPAATKTIADTRIRDVTGSIVIGIVKKDGRMRTNPSGAERLDIGDKIVAIGSEEQLDKLWHMLAKQERTTYNGMRRAG